MSKISLNDVRKVANLSRLQISEDEIEGYTNQLEKILGYFSQLEKVNTQDVQPTTRAVEVVNIDREDSVKRTTIRDELLDQAPQREGNFFRVPKILSN